MVKLPLIIAVFNTPTTVLNLTQWDLLIRQARAAGLLGRLADLLEQYGVLKQVPEKPLQHLQSAQVYVKQFQYSVRWEVICLQRALKKLKLPLIFLKGSAYLLADNQAALGRVFADVDILVPESQLAKVENALLFGGWQSTSRDKYDQHYYRQWMHELPPMRHNKRLTLLDVHHNILPKTAKLQPDADKLLANVVKIAETDYYVLAETDRVLHSAVHLFHDGEFEHGLRDLLDLDSLLREFSQSPQFFNQLIERSQQLDLQRPLYYCFRYCTKLLKTPIPQEILQIIQPQAPNLLLKSVMDSLLLRALMPDHCSCNDSLTGLARYLLYLRSHWLRMPLYLLIPHLLRKSLRRFKDEEQHT